MKGRLKFLHLRVAFALGLFFAVALVYALPLSYSPVTTKVIAADNGDASVPLEHKPSPQDLPNDCAIVASEAAARLASTGAWTRVLFCRFFDSHEHKIYRHALCVWQPPTAKTICVYDVNGSRDLDTDKHDCKSVAAAFGRRDHVLILEAHFIQ